MQVVLNGGFSQTFLNYVGTVLHNVRITDGAQAEKHAQFIQVSFTMPERFSAAGSDGQVRSLMRTWLMRRGVNRTLLCLWKDGCGDYSQTSVGQLIPFESVRVAKGSSLADAEALEWHYPCESGLLDESSIYGDAAVATAYHDFAQVP